MKLNDSIPPVEGVSPMAYRPPVGTHAEDRAAPLVLPPKTSLEVFRQFMQRMEDIVGTENATVVSSDDELQHENYMDPSKAHDVSGRPFSNNKVSFDGRQADQQQMYHVLPKQHFVSSAVVAPRDIPEVQAIMRLCNKFEIPVWPFSIGRNVGYGGAAPRVPGSIGIDMGRNMRKILDVNVDGAYAIVEPGVTFV
jgi:FAD/FMN-containing dehydrogenase